MLKNHWNHIKLFILKNYWNHMTSLILRKHWHHTKSSITLSSNLAVNTPSLQTLSFIDKAHLINKNQLLISDFSGHSHPTRNNSIISLNQGFPFSDETLISMASFICHHGVPPQPVIILSTLLYNLNSPLHWNYSHPPIACWMLN